jgi:nucleoside 2-deoxyribosyltransferase
VTPAPVEAQSALQKRIYLAAPLFSDAERAFNVEIAARLNATGAVVFLPQESEANLAAQRGARTPRAIFESDLAELKKADIVVAIIDGADADSGTAWEMGYAYALGKPIVALRTDFRRVAPDECVNLMLEQSSVVFNTLADLIAEMRVSRQPDGERVARNSPT